MISSSPPRCFWMEVFCGYPMPVLSLYILGVGKHVLITHLLGVQVFRWGTRPKEPYPRNCTEATLSGPGFDLYDKILDFWVNTEMELDFRGFREQAVFCSWEECKIVVTRGKLWQVLFSKDSCTSVSCPPCSATERSCHTPQKRQSLFLQWWTLACICIHSSCWAFKDPFNLGTRVFQFWEIFFHFFSCPHFLCSFKHLIYLHIRP